MEDVIGPEQDRLLSKLDYVGEALFDSYENEKRRQCLDGTRVKILEEIKDWACGTTQQCIYWLQGMAGTGKSTITLTAARQLRHLSLAVVSFFFKRGAGDLAYGQKLIPTIVHQMAYQSRWLRHHVTAAIMKDPNLGKTAGLREQYERLLKKPLETLRSAKHGTRPFVVLIDALDECENKDDIGNFLQRLATTNDLSSLGLRILITSRPEIPVRLGFQTIPKILLQSLALHDVPCSVVDQDIEMFVKYQITKIRHDWHLSKDWPTPKEVTTLVDKAAGLFIFAVTACKYVGGSPQANPRNRLSEVCSTVSENRLMTEELDQMYIIILKGSVQGKLSEEEAECHSRQFRKLVGTIIILYNPLPIPELFKILLNPDIESPIAVRHILNPLQSVLNVPSGNEQPVKLLHLSFRDFLLDRTRCTVPYSCVDERQTHSNLAMSCLDLLSSSIPQNLGQTFYADWQAVSSLNGALTPAVQYACRYWVKHVQGAQMELRDNGFVHKFLKRDFLSWIQSVSLIKAFPGAIEGIRDLTALIDVSLAGY